MATEDCDQVQAMTASGGSMINQNSLSTKLSRERERLESRLGEIKKAEEMLDANPTLKELFDVIARIGHLYQPSIKRAWLRGSVGYECAGCFSFFGSAKSQIQESKKHGAGNGVILPTPTAIIRYGE